MCAVLIHVCNMPDAGCAAASLLCAQLTHAPLARGACGAQVGEEARGELQHDDGGLGLGLQRLQLVRADGAGGGWVLSRRRAAPGGRGSGCVMTGSRLLAVKCDVRVFKKKKEREGGGENRARKTSEGVAKSRFGATANRR